MQNKQREIVAVVIILGLALTILNAGKLLPYPPIEDLLIKASWFPPNWQVTTEGPEYESIAPFSTPKWRQNRIIFFDSSNGAVYNQIVRFSNYRDAEEYYRDEIVSTFRKSQDLEPWLVPNELQYKSESAHQFSFACVMPSYTAQIGCDYVAQYGVYVVLLGVGWRQGTLSYEQLESILDQIDNQMEPFTKGVWTLSY